MRKIKCLFALMALMMLLSSMTAGAEAQVEEGGITINSVTYAVSETNPDLINVTANCNASEDVTSVSVLVVPENTETVTLNKIIYINRFGKSLDGVYNFILSKSKIMSVCEVENFSLANLELRMGCNVLSNAETHTLSLNMVNITEILPLRTHSVSFDNQAKTITIKALSGVISAGFGIETESDSSWTVNEADKTEFSLYVGNSEDLDGARVVVANKRNGMQQNFRIDITCGTKTETYTVNFTFIDESLINFTDILGVRVVSYGVDYTIHKVTLIADRYNESASSAGFGFVLPENVTAEYTLVETSDGGTRVSSPVNSLYTGSYLGMESGYYGDRLLKVLPISNGITQVMEVVLTNSVLNESITWEVNLLFRDPSHEGDVDIAELIGLRTTSATFDNEAKTITLVAPSTASSAGCTAVSTEPSTVRKFSTESGKNLAYGTIDDNRYVVAYQQYGTQQTYRVKVYGGEDGYEYSWYTVTMTFGESASAEGIGTFTLNSSEEIELEEVVWVDEYEASLEEIPENLVWSEELMDFVPVE